LEKYKHALDCTHRLRLLANEAFNGAKAKDGDAGKRYDRNMLFRGGALKRVPF
jgi:hypothetical protein